MPQMPLLNPATRSNRVVVMAHSHDNVTAHLAVTTAVELGLHVDSCTASDALSPRRILVLLLSEAALDDPDFVKVASIAATAQYPTLPVLLDQIPPSRLSPTLAKHNWLDLSGVGTEDRLRQLHRVLATDPLEFLYFQDIAVRADQWRRTGGSEDTLIADVRQAREAATRLEGVRSEASLQQPEVIAPFVRASLAYSRKARMKRRLEWAKRVIAVVVAAASIALVGTYFTILNRQSLASVQVDSVARRNIDPHFYTFQAIQNAQSLDYASHSMVPVLSGLQTPWMVSILHSPSGLDWLGPGQFDENDAYWSELSTGRVVRWNAATATPERTFKVADTRAVFAVDPSGSRIAVATDTRGLIYDTVTNESTPIAAPIKGFSMMAAGRSVGAGMLPDGARTQVVSFDMSTGARLATTSSFETVLDLRDTDAGLRALATNGDSVVLVNAETGEVVFQHRLPASHPLSAGVVTPSGDTFVTSFNGVLYTGDQDGLTPLGYLARDIVTLAVTSSGKVVVSTLQDGVRLVDPILHVELGQLCLGTVSVSSLATAQDGGLVACNNGFTTEVWDSVDFSPAASAPPDVEPSTGAAVEKAGVKVRTLDDSTLEISTDAASTQLHLRDAAPMLTGRTTALAVANAGQGLLVGTSQGWVAEFDIQPTTGRVIQRVQQWRVPTGAPVDALGWHTAAQTLAVRTDNWWWNPPSCLGCSSPGVAVALAKARQPSCWTEQSSALFSVKFEEEMAIERCSPIPNAKG